MKRVGATVKLRVVGDGPTMERGDWLRTSSGRQYEIIEIRGRQLVCIVLGRSAEPGPDVTVFNWHWLPRAKRQIGSHSQPSKNRQ